MKLAQLKSETENEIFTMHKNYYYGDSWYYLVIEYSADGYDSEILKIWSTSTLDNPLHDITKLIEPEEKELFTEHICNYENAKSGGMYAREITAEREYLQNLYYGL